MTRPHATLTLALGVGHKHRGRVRNETWSWSQLVDKLSIAEVGRETLAEYRALDKDAQLALKNVGFFVAGTCRDGVRRKDHVESRSLVCLDFDDAPEGLFAALRRGESGLAGHEFMVHTTRKHQAPDSVRFRVVVPLMTPVEPLQYEPLARRIASWVDPEMAHIDRASFRVAQYMFWPSKCRDGEFVAERLSGALVDPAAVLDEYTDWQDPTEWPMRADERLHHNTNADVRREDPRERLTAPTVAAFCRTYDVHEAIATFLPDVYAEASGYDGDRYTYLAGSSAAGARVYDDGLHLHSEHDTDPAHGQHNAFDLVRLHLYGDLDAEVDASVTPLGSWPSFKAMESLARGDTRVKAALEEVEQEAFAERCAVLDDLLDDDDEDDFLAELGAPVAPVTRQVRGAEDLLNVLAERIEAAETLRALDKIARKVQDIPLQDFSQRFRDMLAVHYLRRAKDLSDGRYSLTRAEAKKHLKPSDKTAREAVRRAGLPEWLEDWVYLSGEDKYLNLTTGERITASGFRAKYDAKMLDNFPVEETGLPSVHADEAATTLFNIPTPYRTQYWPGRGQLYEQGGLEFANSYRDTGAQPDGYPGREGVDLLRIHLANLFPAERDRRLLLDWLAHVAQHPERKLLFAVLLRGVRGDGKTFFIEMMRAVLGESNCTNVTSSMLRKEFNSYAADTQFCGVEEVKLHGVDGVDTANNIKPVISNLVIAMERKGEDVVTVRNFANLFMTTNFHDALPLTTGENRYLALSTRFRTEEELLAWKAEWQAEHGYDFHARLYEHLRDHPYQFRRFLEEEYEFSKWYNPNARAPETDYLRDLVENAKSGERQLVEDVLGRNCEPLLTRRLFVWNTFARILDVEIPGHRMRGRAVAAMMSDLGFLRAGKERIDGRLTSIWSTDPDVCGEGVTLSPLGKTVLAEALAVEEELDDFDLPVSAANVVPLKR